MDDGDGLHDKLGGIDDVGNLQISLCQGTAWCQRVVGEILWTYLVVNSQANHNFCACFQSLLTTLLKIAVLYQKVACTSFSDVCCLFSRSSCSDTHVYGYCYILVVFSRSGLCARTACLEPLAHWTKLRTMTSTSATVNWIYSGFCELCYKKRLQTAMNWMQNAMELQHNRLQTAMNWMQNAMELQHNRLQTSMNWMQNSMKLQQNRLQTAMNWMQIAMKLQQT